MTLSIMCSVQCTVPRELTLFCEVFVCARYSCTSAWTTSTGGSMQYAAHKRPQMKSFLMRLAASLIRTQGATKLSTVLLVVMNVLASVEERLLQEEVSW